MQTGFHDHGQLQPLLFTMCATLLEKRGSCSQYNYTDSKTCNTRSDKLVCDWKATDNTCYAE